MMENLATIAEQRSEFYWFLSGFFLQGPSRAYLDALSRLRSSRRDTAESARAAGGAAPFDAEALSVEFTRLFHGLREGYGPPPPYESVHRENRLMGAITVSVVNAYQEAGFDVIDGHPGPQDHIGAELKFMALLSFREMEARKTGDEREAAACLERQQRFLDQHALQWIPRYCDTIRQQTAQEYFREAMDVTRAFLLDDREQIAELMATTPSLN